MAINKTDIDILLRNSNIPLTTQLKKKKPKKTKISEKYKDKENNIEFIIETLKDTQFISVPEIDTNNNVTLALNYDCLKLSVKRLQRIVDRILGLHDFDKDDAHPFIITNDFKEILALIKNIKRDKRKPILQELKKAIHSQLDKLIDKLESLRIAAVKESKNPSKIFSESEFEIERAIISHIMSLSEDSLAGSFRLQRRNQHSIAFIIDRLSVFHDEKSLIKALTPSGQLFRENVLLIDYSELKTDLWEDVKVRINPNILRRLSTHDECNNELFAIEKTSDPTHKLDEIFLSENNMTDIMGMINLFKNGKVKGMSFLFYGDSGTGKTCLSNAIANELGMKVVKISASNFNEKSLAYAISILKLKYQNSNIMLLFDECESLWYNEFSYSLRSGKKNSERGDVKQVLEKNDCILAFTSNYEPPNAFRRRVSYVLEMKKPTSKVRTSILQKELHNFTKDTGIGSQLSESQLQVLATKYEIPGGFLRQSLLLGASRGCGELSYDSIDTAFKSASEPFGKENNIVFPSIQINHLVLSESQKVTVNRLVQFSNKHLNFQQVDPLMPKGVTVLFEGPSGTGKTALAEAIAHELGLKFRRVTPSTFLSMWVGETEKMIKEVLEDAKEQKYVLFLDEAEGMLASREGAQQSWEKTQVDEWLNQIEQFQGIFIAATNHKDMMDQAFARRFLFKIAFDYPSAVERRKYLNEHFKSALSEQAIMRLSSRFELSFGELRNAVVQSKTYSEFDESLVEIIFEQQIAGRSGVITRRLGIV